jgi:hypothetical protein
LSLQRCEGKNLESVLEEVRSRFGAAVTIVEANRLRKGGVGGFFAKERFEVVVDVDDEPAEVPAEYGMEATEDFCDRLLSMADNVNDHEPAPSTVSTEQPEFSAVLDSITRHMESEPAATEAESGSRLLLRPPPATLARPAVREPVAIPKPAVDSRALARIGLPEDLRRAALANPAPADGTDPSVWLTTLLADLPQPEPMPRGQGAVIVVAGGRDAALHLARSIADDLGLDDDSLLIASAGYTGRARAIPGHRRLHDAEAASEARRSWRRRPRPTVVAVESPTGRSAHWARRVIDALEPTMVWAAVDAARKPEDLFEWSEQLGGFDALAVTGTDDTVSPAAVLQCGIPVGRLEGRDATPALWASLLAPRLAV